MLLLKQMRVFLLCFSPIISFLDGILDFLCHGVEQFTEVWFVLQLFFSYFKKLVGKEVTMELKNDLAIRGTLHSLDQYLNIKLEKTRVVEQDKYPHMVSSSPSPFYSLRVASLYILIAVCVYMYQFIYSGIHFCKLKIRVQETKYSCKKI